MAKIPNFPSILKCSSTTRNSINMLTSTSKSEFRPWNQIQFFGKNSLHEIHQANNCLKQISFQIQIEVHFTCLGFKTFDLFWFFLFGSNNLNSLEGIKHSRNYFCNRKLIRKRSFQNFAINYQHLYGWCGGWGGRGFLN